MARATLSPLINAVISIVETASGVPVGDGIAPDCEGPYMMVTAVSMRPYTGPFGDMESDSDDRIQISGIGATREQADSMRDAIRLALTVAALDTQFTADSESRRTMKVNLDMSPVTRREDRGLPNPIFTAIDQYMIETTPTV